MSTDNPTTDTQDTPPAPQPPAPSVTDTTIQDIDTRVASLEGELRAAREKIKESETRRQIQRLLMEAQTIDVDSATLLAEAALKEGAATLDKLGDRAIAKVIDDIRRRKPLLFRSTPKPRASAMSTRIEQTDTPIASAAEEAARSGHRTDLLRYLRLRRTRLQEAAS